ncbi:hypothetical protein AKO1_002682 [Acrasis kona]|uniref:Uncharacterized protein n=1 Tax=Acrasis kona TaxID=1008807 RepID=A0AAW2ZNP1_9EUKA
MNFFKKIWNTEEVHHEPSEPTTITSEDRLENLESRQRRLEEQIERERSNARTYMQMGNKTYAANCLRRANNLQQQLDQVVNHSLKVGNVAYSKVEVDENKIKELEQQIQLERTKAKDFLMNNNKSAAKECVERKQDLQDELDKLINNR